MKLIDMHCDTILKCVDSKGSIKLKENDLCVDIKKLRSADSLAQFFAMYVDLELDLQPMSKCLDMIDCFYQELEENKQDIAFAGSITELEKNKLDHKVSAILTIEEGGVLEGKLENLRNLYRLGVRLITILWNFPNCIGYPNHEWKYKDYGLTEFGEQTVAEMNRFGMIIDVSHLSDQGFYDVAKLTKAPFVASHSNARAVQNHSRNLTDDMLITLARAGGVTGINLEPIFLGEEGSVEMMIKHIKHIKKVAGIDVIAVGTDFDGTSPLTAIKHVGQMGLLTQGLSKAGFPTEEIEKIMYKNAQRVIRDVIK